MFLHHFWWRFQYIHLAIPFLSPTFQETGRVSCKIFEDLRIFSLKWSWQMSESVWLWERTGKEFRTWRSCRVPQKEPVKDEDVETGSHQPNEPECCPWMLAVVEFGDRDPPIWQEGQQLNCTYQKLPNQKIPGTESWMLIFQTACFMTRLPWWYRKKQWADLHWLATNMVLKDTDSMLHKCYLSHHSQQISSFLQQSACLCICFWYTWARTQKTTIVDRYQDMLTCIMYVCVYMEICVRSTYTHMYRLYISIWCLLRFVLINTPGMDQILLFIQFIELNRFAHGRSWPWSCFAGSRGWRVVEKLMNRMTLLSDFWQKKADTILEVTESDKMEQTRMGWMISWYWWNFSPVYFSHKIYPYRWCSADLRRKRSKSKNKCWEPQLACWPQPSYLSGLAFKLCHHFPRGIRDLKTQPWISLSSLAQGA